MVGSDAVELRGDTEDVETVLCVVPEDAACNRVMGRAVYAYTVSAEVVDSDVAYEGTIDSVITARLFTPYRVGRYLSGYRLY